MKSTRFSCRILKKLEFFNIFSKNTPISNFMKNRPIVRKVFHADKHDEANSLFSQFCESASKYQQFLCEHSNNVADKVKIVLYRAERKIPANVRKVSNEALPLPSSHRKPEGLSLRVSQARHCTLVRPGFNAGC
jgi:hypothetical protein